MSDIREALEEAFKVIHCANDPAAYRVLWLRFRRFLDAEAWTDAALCLVPEGWAWQVSENSRSAYATIVHVDVTEEEDDRVYSADGATGALAIAQAALRAKEAGDVHQTPA